MARIARRLHDRAGPALCAAGLQLSLIEQLVKAPPGSGRADAIAGLREALDESMNEVRILSYLCDPSLVARLGLKAAIGYLARAVPLDAGDLGAFGARKDGAAAAAFEVLRKALLFWFESCPDVSFGLSAGSQSLKLAASMPAPPEAAGLVVDSGGTMSKDRLAFTLKVGKAKGGSLK